MFEIVLPEVPCSTAKEFMQALSPIGEFLHNNDVNPPWLFRGQGKDFPLIPSLFRKNGKISSLTHRHTESYSELLLAERDILIRFFQNADKRGLVLPDDSQELRSYLDTLNENDNAVGMGIGEWIIFHKALSLIALAQHYGIPTRLLDWTRQPYIAAFFAAEDANRNIKEWEPSEKLIVWSFYFPALGKQALSSDDSYFIRGVTAPSASNPNLMAQQGVFTLVNPGATEEKSGNYKPFDKILEYYASGNSHEEWFLKSTIRKFTLPISEAPHLLFLLAKMDITPSAIYPGYQSIVDDIKNQKAWEELSGTS
jgi:hypothetical protein